ncbi:MAG: TolC family protein [Spirochaetales bacterium]|uniref:TolC family protein n=1 Tax=Candidatus Thalassospirochaeta sargassi TaxID=3119039 RepID=A0AAJ1MPC6_9SPIO|nr:TolC family protein [Spirochaetales bacterium]
MKKTTYLVLILACTALPVFANSLVLTEESAVEMALAQNLELKSSKLDLEMTEDQNNNSWNILLPDLSVTGGLVRSDSLSDSLIDGSWTLSGSVDASVTLNTSSFLYMDYDRLSHESQLLSYQMDEDELIVEVKKDFYYLLAYQQSLELERKNLELAEKRQLQTETNFKNGLASELDVLEAQNAYESLRPSYTTTKTSYETQLMSFKSLIGLALKQPIELEGELTPDILELDAEKLVNTFLPERQDVQSSLKALEVKENLLSITNLSDRSPSLTLSLDWDNSASDLTSIDWSDSFSVSTYLTMPLNGFIPGSKESIEISDAQKAVKQARLNYQNVVDSAEQEIRTLVMELSSYRENIDITKQSVQLARKTYEMTEAAYNQGTKELLYVEEAQNTLFSAELDLLESRYNYLSGLLDLQYALNTSADELKTFSEK